MIRYFFKLAFRNIKKYKVNTLISIFGLTVGLASFILIASYIKHELSFNKNNEHYDRIFTANIDFYMPSGVEQGNNMPYPLVEGLVSTFPEVENGVRLNQIYSQLSNDEISFFENTGYYVDNSFFEIFTVNFLSGDKANALNEPNTIVLTKKYANKYFGDENPTGKNLLLDGKYILKVTGVIDNLPVNSDFRYDFFVSMKTFLAINSNRDYTQCWFNHQFQTIFMLDENSDYKKLSEKIAGFFDNRDDEIRRVLYLNPLSMYHLKPHKDDNSFKILVIFGLIAIFILIIACINFINLSIANAANRIKETSIRRIVGSNKSSLILQQIGESVLLSFISFDLAYLLAERLLPNFNAILQTEISSKIILNYSFIFSMFGIALLLGVVSGIFPAIKISRIQPLKALNGKETRFDRAGIGKKGLIVIQYAVSIVLIISTIIIFQQFNYIKNKDLGFDKEYLITCYVGKDNNESNPELKSFKEEILRQAGVQNLTLSHTLPFYGNSDTYIRKDGAAKEEVISIVYNMADMSFLETYNIDLLLKKEFSETNSSSELRFCYINQTAANTLGFENPIGENIFIGDDKIEIVGVCNDFHIYSVENKIPAQMIDIMCDAEAYDHYRWMTIKCDGHNPDKIKEFASTTLKEFFPENPYSFFNYGDTDFKTETLNKVQGIEKSFGFFTLIAIVIACMGIFGLVALTVKHKTKEIGIRKVLGSSVFEIYKLIAREYLILAVLGNILAWFPAWFVVNKILQDFAYRIDINITVFVLAFISSILLTIITIAFHTVKAARTNPVEALRYE